MKEQNEKDDEYSYKLQLQNLPDNIVNIYPKIVEDPFRIKRKKKSLKAQALWEQLIS